MATKLFDPTISVVGGAAYRTKPVDTRPLPVQMASTSAPAPPPAPP